MTIALTTLPGATINTGTGQTSGSGSVIFEWDGSSWIHYSGECTSGSPVAPNSPGTTSNEHRAGTCMLTYPITAKYDGFVETLLQDPEGVIDDLIERYHSRELSKLLCKNAAENINRGNGLLIHNYEELPAPKLNQLVIPTGATRWSYCLLLADESRLTEIYKMSNNGSTALQLVYGSETEGKDETGNIIALTVWTLPPRMVTPEELGSDRTNNLWIIPVVDDRYWWQYQHVDKLSETLADIEDPDPDDYVNTILGLTNCEILNVAVNIVHEEFPTCATENDYENLPLVIDSVIGHYGQTLVVDIGNWNTQAQKYETVTPHSAPSGVTRFAVIDGANSAWVLLASASGELGLQASHFSLDGSIPYILNSAAARKVFVNDGLNVAGGLSNGYPFFGPYASVPESVDIQVSSGVFENFTALKANPKAYKFAVPGAAIWRTSFIGEPGEKAKLQIARDYYYQYGAQFDYTFAGVQPWQQTRFDDYMVFRQTWNPQTKAYDAYTRICSRQPNLTGEWVGSSSPRRRVIIVGALPAPVNGVPGEGVAAGITYKPDDPGKGKMVATNTRYNILNFDPGLTAVDGTFAKIEQLDGKWDCYWVGCGAVSGMTGLDPTP